MKLAYSKPSFAFLPMLLLGLQSSEVFTSGNLCVKRPVVNEDNTVTWISTGSCTAQNSGVPAIVDHLRRSVERAANRDKTMATEAQTVPAVPTFEDTAQSGSIQGTTTATGETSESPIISTVSPASKEVSSTVKDAMANSTQVRLVGGGSPNEGRVEIYHNGEWGTVCDDDWGLADADVICRMLGYTLATAAPMLAHFGEGSGRIWIDDLKCFGNESDISACVHGGWGIENCGHSEDASVICSHETAAEIWHVSASNVPDWTVRLVNGTTGNEGRVEVSRHGVWGTICGGYGWDTKNGNVICRMMGYSWASNTWRDAHFGQGDGPVWLGYLNCGGHESNIAYCHSEYPTCNHENDLSVRCA